MKRPASAADSTVNVGGPPTKKPAASPEATGNDVIERQCELLEKALMEHDSLPIVVRRMLSSQLVNSIGVPKDERHAVQEQVVIWVGEVIESTQSTLEQNIEIAEAKMADADGEKANLEAAVSKASADHTAKLELLETKTAAVKESSTEVKLKEKCLRDAEVLLADGDTELLKSVTKKQQMDEMMSEAFAKLKAGDDKVNRTDLLKIVGKYANDIEVDADLFAASIVKEPGSRGTFDTVIIEVVEKDLNKSIDILGEATRTAESVKHDRTAHAEAAQAAVLAAVKVRDDALQGAQEASQAEAQSQEELNCANQAVHDFARSVKTLSAELAALKVRSRQFVEGPGCAFKTLESRVSAKMMAERQIVEEAAAAEKAATEAAATEATGGSEGGAEVTATAEERTQLEEQAPVEST